jgi:uncharacterized protein
MANDREVVHVAKLRRARGTTQHEHRQITLDPDVMAPATVADSAVPDSARANLDLVLASFEGGIMATGVVTAPWVGVCRRCTTAVGGELVIAVRERFAERPGPGEPADEDAYPIEVDVIDLGPMVHDAILGELPLAPLCRDDCLGLCTYCGVDRNVEQCDCVAPPDPRWAALDALRTTS